MSIFGRKRGPAHSAGVIYVYEKRSDLVPYYSAVCKCGWFAEPAEAGYPDLACEQRMAAAALAHDPAADTTVAFPLDDPENL
jgi:hypothetical protein